jgi:hypothetical protein
MSGMRLLMLRWLRRPGAGFRSIPKGAPRSGFGVARLGPMIRRRSGLLIIIK